MNNESKTGGFKRSAHRTHFTSVSNTFIRDNTISGKAKHIMQLLMSFSEDWVFYISHLETLCKEGKDYIKSALRELEELGYLIRVQNKTSEGRFSSSTYFFSDFIEDLEPYKVLVKSRNTVDGFSVSGESATKNTKEKNNTKTKNPQENISKYDANKKCNEAKRVSLSVFNDKDGESPSQGFKERKKLADWFRRAEDMKLSPVMGHDSFKCLCPCHNDKTSPNLTISKGTKVDVVVKCNHPLCNAGMREVSQKFWNSEIDGQVREHFYKDESGQTLGKKVKKADGSFAWFQFEDGKRKLGKPKDVTLYNLPHLVSNPTKPVYICEGEKDADTLTKLGLVAVSGPHGAGKWSPSYNSYVLNSPAIAIVLDSDEAGLVNGEVILDTLCSTVMGRKRSKAAFEDAAKTINKKVTIILPVKGKDITEHLDSGLSLGDCRTLTPQQFHDERTSMRFVA